MQKLPINPVLKWIKSRIDRNKNVIIIINGPTGSGKTYSAIELCRQVAETCGSNFTIKDNMAFNFTDLLKKTMLPQNTEPGTPFLFEEVGSFSSGSSARSWQSQANQFFFSFMQTTRHRRQVLIMTCPHFSFLERGARSLVHLQMEMNGIDINRNVSLIRPYRVQVNSRTGNFYFKYLRVTYQGKKFVFKILELPKPPEEICLEYEKLKGKFTAELNKSIISKAEEVKVDKRKNSKLNDKKIQELVDKGISHKNVGKMLGVSAKTISRHLRKMQEAQE